MVRPWLWHSRVRNLLELGDSAARARACLRLDRVADFSSAEPPCELLLLLLAGAFLSTEALRASTLAATHPSVSSAGGLPTPSPEKKVWLRRPCSRVATMRAHTACRARLALCRLTPSLGS